MSDLMLPIPQAPVTVPQAPVTVRAGTMDDIPFIDSLQKTHAKMVGFMPAMQLEGKINAGHVLIAEEVLGPSSLVLGQNKGQRTNDKGRLGYVIGQDRYFKHDDVGIIYHLNVAPGHQRGFVGATLLKAMFDRAAYGCKLFCCWCAQDIEANRFWESMGFVPLAFRAGSEKKARTHIFWQKRIRAGDQTTPWWFPAKTDAGAMRADRLVLPIPPGLHWSDEMPVLKSESPQTPRESRKRVRSPEIGATGGPQEPTPRPRAAMQFGIPSAAKPVAVEPAPAPTPAPKPAKPARPKERIDPKLVAAARELRDRWLERVNGGEYLLEGAGKYDVARAIDVAPVGKQLPFAA